MELKGDTFEGLGARFGATLPTHEKKGLRIPASLAKPSDCCSSLSSKLSGSIALCLRGTCEFSTKAEIAQSGGAAGMLVINNDEDGLPVMECPTNPQTSNITIHTVVIIKADGEVLSKAMEGGSKVELLFYAPVRPVVEFSVVFLWLMSVGTVAFASLWSEFTASEQIEERYNELSPKDMIYDVKDFGKSCLSSAQHPAVERLAPSGRAPNKPIAKPSVEHPAFEPSHGEWYANRPKLAT